MKEVKPSKKPLAIYYAIVLLVLLVINLVVMPWLAERQVQEVDYGTFMSMTEQENIGKVDIQSNQIIFTDKDNKQIYKTGLKNDPGLTERLYDAGAQFSSEIVEQGSPVLSFLLWFVLPILLGFFARLNTSGTVTAMVSVQEYVSYVISTMLIFGVIFETPIVLVALTGVGLVKPKTLQKNFKYVVLIILIVAAVITPPDVTSQVLVAIPLMILFYASIILCKILFRRKLAEQEEDLD